MLQDIEKMKVQYLMSLLFDLFEILKVQYLMSLLFDLFEILQAVRSEQMNFA